MLCKSLKIGCQMEILTMAGRTLPSGYLTGDQRHRVAEPTLCLLFPCPAPLRLRVRRATGLTICTLLRGGPMGRFVGAVCYRKIWIYGNLALHRSGKSAAEKKTPTIFFRFLLYE